MEPTPIIPSIPTPTPVVLPVPPLPTVQMPEPVLVQPAPVTEMPMICPQCHQIVSATEYFCPNCGKNLHEPPLSTTAYAQAGLYLFSIALPLICFVFAGRWKGIKYAKSKDPKAKTMGFIAIALIVISTGVLMWLTIVWVNQTIQQQVSSLNLDGLE